MSLLLHDHYEIKFIMCMIFLLYQLSEGCSHVAAILFKVEAATRNGYTAVTSSCCKWNEVFSSKV